MTESATVCARLSAIRSSIVGGSVGHARIAMLAIGTGTAAASASRPSRAPRAADGARAPRAPPRQRAKAPALPGCSGSGPPPTTLRGDAVRRQTALGELVAPARGAAIGRALASTAVTVLVDALGPRLAAIATGLASVGQTYNTPR